MKPSASSVEIPRLEFDQLESTLRRMLEPRVRRLGYLGEFFRVAAHQPAALRAFLDFTEESKRGLPENLVETIALTVSVLLGNDYERNQHERLCVRLGLGKDWIAAVTAVDPDGGKGLSDEERRVQRLVRKMAERSGHHAEAEVDSVTEALGPKRAVAVLLVAGRYVTHALVVNALDLASPVPSIFEDGFEG